MLQEFIAELISYLLYVFGVRFLRCEIQEIKHPQLLFVFLDLVAAVLNFMHERLNLDLFSHWLASRLG